MDAFRHNLAHFQMKSLMRNLSMKRPNVPVIFVKSLKGKELDTVLIVGHGANLTAIRTLVMTQENSAKMAGLDNTSVTILSTDDFEHYHLDTWNDTSYMED